MTGLIHRARATAFILGLLISLRGFAQPAGPTIDPTAETVLRRMGEVLKGAETLRYTSYGTVSMSAQNFSKDISTKTVVSAKRPNLINLQVRRGTLAIDNISDGSALVSYVPPLNLYLSKPAPANWPDLVIRNLATQAAVIEDTRFGFFFLMDDPYSAAIRGASVITYVGNEDLNGAPCHRIRFARQPYNVDLLVETGPKAVPRRFQPDTSSLASKFADKLPGLEVSIELTLDGWEINPSLPDSTFQFTPPEGAEERESFAEMMRPKDPKDLIGKPAPAFAADLLSGKKFNPADHKGKNVVILDFWATRCAPCVMALPILAEIAKEYKDRGVVVIPLNVEDTTATIQQFLETKGLDLEVGLDDSGKAGMLYYVNGIPQTVIIGKDGIVADVHVGFGPNMGVLLREDIEGLLAGRPINRQAQTGGPPR